MTHIRWRIRVLLLTGVVGTVLLSVVVAERAGARVLRNRLAERLPPEAINAFMEDFSDAFVSVGLTSALIGTGVALLIGHFLSGALLRLRAATVARARGTVTSVQPAARAGIVEIHSLAGAVDFLANELTQKGEALAREREELALLVGAASEGIVQIGGDARIVHANPAARSLLGLPASLRGQPVASIIRNTELRDVLERAVKGEEVDSHEVNTDDRRLLVSTRPLRVGGTVPAAGSGTIVSILDLTEVRRLEGVRRDFVANVSHELKTPLTSIRGYVETMLTDDLPTDMQRQFLEVVRKNADRLHHIVDDLLDLSRLESGGWRPEMHEINARELVEDVWSTCSERAVRKHIDFTVCGNEHVVVADPGGLRQVLSNLFDNAIRYTPEGGRVTARLDRVPALDGAAPDGDPAWIVIEVRDTGAGIPRDALARVFERFYRVDPARSRAEGGTGLGLSIVKHLMESMDGEVSAESELGKGTAVRLRLRAAE